LLAEYALLKQNEDRVQNHYDHILHLLQNVGLDKNVDQESVVILDQAVPATFKKTKIQKALAGIIGLIIGLGIIGMLAAQDDRLRSISEVKLHFPEVLLGQIPDASGRRRKDSLDLLHRHDCRHAFAESYRGIRSSLLFMARAQAPPRTI